MSGTEITEADMSQDMVDELVSILEAVDKPQDVLDIAQYIRIQFEERHGKNWNCVVGCNCGDCSDHVPIICTVATHPGGWA